MDKEQVKHLPALAQQAVRRNFDFPRWASHIRSKRRSQQWTTRGVGKAIGVSAATYSRWENLTNLPTTADFLFVCWLFDLNPIDYVLPPENLMKTELMFIASETREWSTK